MITNRSRFIQTLVLLLCCTQLSVGWPSGSHTSEARNRNISGLFRPQTGPDGRVLESTVQIIMVRDLIGYDNLTHQETTASVGVLSLGALVYQHGIPKLYTHNHYDANPNFPLGRVDRVLFLNANGEYLAQMSGQEFRVLLAQAQNPGSALVAAPPGLRPEALAHLSQVSPMPKYAELGDPQKLVAGAVISVPHRVSLEPSLRNDRLTVLQAMVVSTDQLGGGSVPMTRLRVVPDVTLVGGDSGGPIWYRGQVVGNTWSTILKQSGQCTGDFWASTGLAVTPAGGPARLVSPGR